VTPTPRPLRRDRRFATLWAGQTVSLVGSQVTAFAVPLVAALSLGASAAQMGLLTAAEFAPSVALGLIAGVWIDRLPRRPILIAADLGRAVLLATIPAAALAGALRIEQLYAVALLVGALGLFADVGRGSLLPSLVGRASLPDANAKLAGVYRHGSDAIRAWLRAVMRGTPDAQPERYAAGSPITCVERVRAPVFIVQGRHDTTTPPQPVEEYAGRLRALGRDVELHWFEGGHLGPFADPERSIEHQERMLRFAHRVLGGR
jgi:pimeloyl-ACP methyl ester carboxylesterase